MMTDAELESIIVGHYRANPAVVADITRHVERCSGCKRFHVGTDKDGFSLTHPEGELLVSIFTRRGLLPGHTVGPD